MSVLMHYQIIGLNISKCRHERHLTQEQLAERAGICQQYLSRLERGKGIPSLETIMALCDALNVDSNRLLTRSATHNDEPPCRLRSDDPSSCPCAEEPLSSNAPDKLIVIDPQDLPIVDLELPDTDYDDPDC